MAISAAISRKSMKKLLSLVFLLVIAASAKAHVLEEAWERYSAMERSPAHEKILPTPGELLGRGGGSGEAAFDYPWKYRAKTYEMHFANPSELAKGVYGLALYAGDIKKSVPREKFYSGVLGFHYSAAQIAGWLNWVIDHHAALDAAENVFAGKMLVNGIVKLGKNGFEATGAIRHVLGSAGGKKRSFAQNLLHERLHVFWDEDRDFRDRAMSDWISLSEAEKDNIRKALKNYNQENEAQLVEEWAIGNAEKSVMSIR